MPDPKVLPANAKAVVRDALEKNRAAADEVAGVADELGVVHAVISTEMPSAEVPESAAHAIERARILQNKLDDASQQLEEVNRALDNVSKESDRR